ncbi:MAG: peroxiredoxin [Pseudomonadota bacterium]|nr:peroxiredoxin [Pseudomonadota bacterium]
MSQIDVGDQLPSFSVTATGGQTITEENLKGKFTVIYFYPKDNTPGCTTEGQEFRDLHDQFQALNSQVFGVSRDSIKSHENFKTKQMFPFDLLSDPDEVLCQVFDVIREKNMYGKKVLGIERSTFLINPEGAVAQIWRKVKAKGHAKEVLDTIADINT